MNSAVIKRHNAKSSFSSSLSPSDGPSDGAKSIVAPAAVDPDLITINEQLRISSASASSQDGNHLRSKPAAKPAAETTTTTAAAAAAIGNNANGGLDNPNPQKSLFARVKKPPPEPIEDDEDLQDLRDMLWGKGIQCCLLFVHACMRC